MKSLSSSSRNAKLLAIFLLAGILLNFPFLGVFKQPYFIGKFPTLLLYLFFVWGLIIFLTARLVERNTNKAHEKNKKNDY